MSLFVEGLGEFGLSNRELPIGEVVLVKRRFEIVGAGIGHIGSMLKHVFLFESVDEATKGKEVLRLVNTDNDVTDIILRVPHDSYPKTDFTAAFLQERPLVIPDVKSYLEQYIHQSGGYYRDYNGNAEDFRGVVDDVRNGHSGGAFCLKSGGFSFEPIPVVSLDASDIGTPPILPLEWKCDLPYAAETAKVG